MDEKLRRVAVVTGASRGIGLAIVTKLAAEGFDVAACSRVRSDGLEAVMACHPAVRFFLFDLADVESVTSCAQHLHKAHARIDVLVNAAGIAAGGLFSMTRVEDMKRVFDINYFHQILFTQYVAKKMMRARSGSIVNIASVAGSRADAGTLSYGGSKAALIHATGVLATELGPFDIRVNAISPAVVETDMAAEMDEKARAVLNERSALGGEIKPADVAGLVSFLVSEAASKMTGQILCLDRGLH
ncbi:SDR family NAD(P)-dependent oxidoreductase [Gluconacetobacter diazotrophicus]|uniref:3-oxoacyl-[acyl-carrier-protein] reductase n=1 Tax=Gluconacetobacter diazotrophicus (strain ATCC 49037 / DSM 5601 / CCUG 37298 / CIP 103539 / LMG 7603 / PAl5) TaxID=272568 RepID=A9HRN1_GLUDA|nr:SDR family oxidoreductase [Gluconacetobacter diazotrophicus]CAP56946.1 3-oxoacyl-[acyl-carrier-protein] reductase [Gluconacetobacter diazotrophicus PA1 5]